MDENILANIIPIIVGLACFMFVIAGATVFRKGLKQYEEKYLSKTAQELDEMFLVFSPEQFLYLNILSVFVLGALAYFFTTSWKIALLFAIIGYLLPRFILSIMKKRRLKRFDAQLVDALTTMANSLKAGFSLLQTFELVSREMTPPISQEFGLMLRENKLGVHLDRALQNMTARIPSANLDLVVTSIIIARTAGGNLAEIFEKIAETIREISRLEGKIDSLTAQGRLQGIIMSILPVLIALAVWFIDRSLMMTLITDPLGWGLIGVIILLIAVGNFLIWRIVSIDI